MYCFQIRQFIVIRIDAGAEEEACIPPVDDLVVAELDKVGLVFLVSRGDEAVDLFLSCQLSDSNIDRGREEGEENQDGDGKGALGRGGRARLWSI